MCINLDNLLIFIKNKIWYIREIDYLKVATYEILKSKDNKSI